MYFFPEPHGHGSLRPTFSPVAVRGAGVAFAATACGRGAFISSGLSGSAPRDSWKSARAIIVGISVMWTYITVAEYVNAREGLGQMIQNSKRFSAMDQVFAGIIVIIALALVTYQTMTWIKRKLYSWETFA